ncbi:outer membrane protein assembly factor BamE [Gilvimarinus agarilyticus]|uniref:outer membrane protein assembly factor BamE n=1 Tax=Gilvimarinus agarilyticus TaxID=679259 RepID=UPI001E63DA69|nr:outer membrane protein assembly factor BamE [Gilvimarinus agarilyticus]
MQLAQALKQYHKNTPLSFPVIAALVVFMEILPKIGISQIKLGMSMDQVRSVLGDPSNIETFIPIEDQPEDRTVDWFYGDTEYSFGSEGEFLLGSIQSSCPNLTLNNLPIIGISVKELKVRFPLAQLDDEFNFYIDEYRHSELQLSFWVRDGAVYMVTVYPEYNKEGTEVIWPQ